MQGLVQRTLGVSYQTSSLISTAGSLGLMTSNPLHSTAVEAQKELAAAATEKRLTDPLNYTA